MTFVLIGLSALGSPAAVAQVLFAPPDTPEQYLAGRSNEKIVVDGTLNEAAWELAAPIGEFIQKDPEQGAPISHPTEVRVVFDDEALYIAAVCHQPMDTIRVQNLQRDFDVDQNDLFGIAIDGFLDRRNAVVFQVTPHGSQRDMEVIDGDELNTDWDTRWDVRTQVHDGHWTVEIAIPWRSLRYPAGADRLGVVFARSIRSRNETASAPGVPRVLDVYRMAYEAELLGVSPPPPRANVQVTPYVLGQAERDSGLGDEEVDAEVGGELKWAVTPNTVLDVTVNTDFAQADVDEQVVNLDRFNVFFPERRQFFLENANVFNPSVTDWIRPFFSRRIGLDDRGNPIPIDGGLRLTSRSSDHQVGLLAMRQDELDTSPASSFAVARYSRNVLGQSRIGGMVTYRHDEASAAGGVNLPSNENYTYTVDGLWRSSQATGVHGMFSVSQDERTGSGIGAQLWAFYENNSFYVGLLEYFNSDYNPGVGLEIFDANYVMHSPAVSFDLRPEWLPEWMRSINPGISAYVFQSSDDGDLLFGYAPIRPLRVYFQNGANIGLFVEPNWQRLDEPFTPVGITIAPGDYDYTRYRLEAESDLSARLSASATIETGDYFDGRLDSYALSGRWAPWPQLEVSADAEFNRIHGLGIAAEDRNTRLYGVTTRLALNPRLQFSAFYQKNSATSDDVWNIRMSWEFRPLSYLYLVYNRSDRDSADMRDPPDREQLIAKVTYLFDV